MSRFWLFVLFCVLSVPASAAGVLVNEVQTGGPASGYDEFVEIVNVSSSAADLTGWKLVYRSAAGTGDSVLVTFPAGMTLPSGTVLLYAGKDYYGAKDGDIAGGISETGGAVALKDASGAVVDAVGYGAATNILVETRPTVAPAPGHSIQRIPCGTDTDNNARDFQELVEPTPREPCAGTGPVVSLVTFQPDTVVPKGTTRIDATVTARGAHIERAVADLTPIGGAAAATLIKTGEETWAATITVPENAPLGRKVIIVTATDAVNEKGSGLGILSVLDPNPGPVVINEIQAGGSESADEEFVELYNRTDAPVDLTGYRLVYRPATGTSDSTLCTITGGMIRAHGYYLLASADFAGACDAPMSAALASSGGGVALRDPFGAVVDSVGYGSATNAYVENMPAPKPDPGQSIERSPAGTDTNNNAADFAVLAVPTPTPGFRKPVVSGVSFSPPAVDPGGSTYLTATVRQGDAAIASVTADLTVVGGAERVALSRGGGDAWTVSVPVANITTPGTKSIPVTARDELGNAATRSGALVVKNPVPPPALKVNEVKTGSAGLSSDEFVELFNPTAEDVSLYGWKLAYRSGSATADTTLYAFANQNIRAGGYLLLAGDRFSGDRDASLAGSLGSPGGVALRDPYDRLVDSVGYGKAANGLVEGAAAPEPEPGQSIERSPAGTDTDNNAADFHLRATPTPTPAFIPQTGDVNKDSTVDARDVIAALRLAGGLATGSSHTLSVRAADLHPATPDGRVTVMDALKLARLVGGF